ncbi:MAG: carotenoid 1,2-hydratase [Pseudomonadota bacterium]
MAVELPAGLHADTLPGRTQDPESDYFCTDTEANGYRWWYLDVVSDDRQHSLVIIGFVGSVFSPYYAAARRRGPTDPFNYCALNAILYGPGRKKRWALTERGSADFASDACGVRIADSRMYWQDGRLIVDINERCNPLPFAFKGQVALTPDITNTRAFALHSNGKHHWWPAAPVAHATVALSSPDLTFSGSAYLDSNFGSEPLENGFVDWDWSRRETVVQDGQTPLLTYRCTERDTSSPPLSLAVTPEGTLCTATVGEHQTLSNTGWRVARATQSQTPVQHVKTLEDTPFYARSLLTHADGQHSMHESLSLDRFASRWVQTLLPFRMPRNASRR